MLAYGPAEEDVLVVETYGELELEYAALRKGCVLIDLPQRSVLEAAGPDRLDFLNRMVTQELKGLAPHHARRSFWLNRKGRIDGDVRIVELGDRTLLDLDVHAAARTLSGLRSFLVSEDCRIDDATETTHRLAVHGPTAIDLLRAASEAAGGVPLADLSPGSVALVTLRGVPVTVLREDQTAEIGLELFVRTADAPAVYQHLVEIGQPHDESNGNGPASKIRLRPAGWHAYNMARIEAGWPLYLLDFGADSLPAETGVLDDRVSFTKGCYLGQEIVARMHARGHPKQRLVALKLHGPLATGPGGHPRQPVTGAQVFGESVEPEADAVGVITSSAISPMLGSAAVCFGMVRYASSAPGTHVRVAAEGVLVPALVQPGLAFWKRL